MKQNDIKELLHEAASSDCTSKRRGEILADLVNASSWANDNATVIRDGRLTGMKVLLEESYKKIINTNPASLPNLLVPYTMICGDKPKDGKITSEVDFALIW